MGYQVREIDLDANEAEFLAFRRNAFPNWPQQKYSWFYKNNPGGRAVCCVIRETQDNVVVGSTAVFPRRFLVRGHLLTGGITGDLGVEKGHRSLGPALQLQRQLVEAAARNRIDLLYGLPNRNSEPIQKRIGYRVLGKTVRLCRVLRSYEHVRKRIPSAALASIVSKALDVLLKVISRESYMRRDASLKIELPTSFDQRFDDLWRRASSEHAVIGERTSAFLNWRFVHCPYRDYHVFALAEKQSNNLLGYIVWSTAQNRIIINDLLAVPTERAMTWLISEFVKYHRRQGSEQITFVFFGTDNIIGVFRKFNFWFSDIDQKVVTLVPEDTVSSSYLAGKNNWYLTEADNDM